MDDSSRSADQVGLIARMSVRIRAGEALARIEVEQVLERGFGSLMQMEAQLQSVRRGPGGGTDPPAPGAEELQHSIVSLRDALSELRTLSGPDDVPRIGYGFVLPGDPGPPHARSRGAHSES